MVIGLCTFVDKFYYVMSILLQLPNISFVSSGLERLCMFPVEGFYLFQ